MLKIGENIHIIAPSVKEALKERDGGFFVDLARKKKPGRTSLISIWDHAKKTVPKSSSGL